MKQSTFSRSICLLGLALGMGLHAQAQWDGTPIPTFTNTSNVGIGYGPTVDARLKIRNTFGNSPGTSPLDQVQGLVIQRNLNFPLLNTPIPNIMEVWKQDYNVSPPAPIGPMGPNELRYIIDGEGNVGIGKTPLKSLDVAHDANVDETLTVGGVAGTSSSVDVLTVSGNITFNRPSDGQYRIMRARTNTGALSFMANTVGEDGPTITLNGKTNTASGAAGAVTMSCVGAPGNTGFEFNNYNPSGSGSWNSLMRISTEGKVSIGAPSMTTPGTYKLYVKDGILTEKIKVALSSDPGNWSDFVFAEDYQLRSLNEVESYIAQHKHLPEIPSTEEVHKEGLDLAQMDAKLLQKIEELTLYVIQQQKEIESLKKGMNH